MADCEDADVQAVQPPALDAPRDRSPPEPEREQLAVCHHAALPPCQLRERLVRVA
jgi:hypothetical protein